MKPRIGVYVSEQMAARLTAAAKRSGKSKSALVEAALAQFLGASDHTTELPVDRRLSLMSRQLEELDRGLRIVNETVALQARFHLAVTPVLPAADQRAACMLGSERFDELAAQVKRRVQLGTSLMQETMDRLDTTKRGAATAALSEAAPQTCSPVHHGVFRGARDGGDDLFLRRGLHVEDPVVPAQPGHGDLVGDGLHIGHVVADEDDRVATLAQPLDEVEDLRGLLDAEGGGGLVDEDDELGLAEHRTGDGDGLALTAGERGDRDAASSAYRATSLQPRSRCLREPAPKAPNAEHRGAFSSACCMTSRAAAVREHCRRLSTAASEATRYARGRCPSASKACGPNRKRRRESWSHGSLTSVGHEISHGRVNQRFVQTAPNTASDKFDFADFFIL